MKPKPVSKDKERLASDIASAFKDVGIKDPIAQRAVLAHAGLSSELPASTELPREKVAEDAVASEASLSPDEDSAITSVLPAKPTERVYEIAVTSILPSPAQPRTLSTPDADEELMDSIRVNGVMTPVHVREAGQGRFELIAGHRRWKAVMALGLPMIPALVRKVSDSVAAAQALIDNLVRESLSPYDEARAFQYLIEKCGYLHKEVAAKIGCNRSRITHAMGILELPEPLLSDFFAPGSTMTIRHAEALLPLRNEPGKLDRVARRARVEQWTSERIRDEASRERRFNQGPQVFRLKLKGTKGEKGFEATFRFSRNQIDKLVDVRSGISAITELLSLYEQS